MIRSSLLALALLLVPAMPAEAEVLQTPAFNGVTLQGKSEAVVSGPSVTLGDVANIMSPRAEDDAKVARMRQIAIAASPKAGESLRLEGAKVLERVAAEGIDLNAVRYTIPTELTVTRSFREVQMAELEQALSAFLEKNPKPLDVKKISIDRPVRIPTDSLGVEVVALESTRPGHIGIDYKAVSATDEARFQLRASADSWRMLPTASKPLKRGSVVGADDVRLTKLHDTASNKDALENPGDILGHVMTRDVSQGEVFRANVVDVPSVISAGSKVSLVVRQGRLEVTASGIAIESGPVGKEIKVQNESSKKVISGRIEGPGVVVVGAY